MRNPFKKTPAKNKQLDEVTLRAAYVYNKAIGVGMNIMEETLSQLEDIKDIPADEEIELQKDQQAGLKRAVSRLLLFWITRSIWEDIIKDDKTARKVNKTIFSLFKSGFDLNIQDIEDYAKVSGTYEEMQIYGSEVAKIFECHVAPAVLLLNMCALNFFEQALRDTVNAFELPLDEINEYMHSVN